MSDIPSAADLRAEAGKLGLKGSEVLDFVNQQQSLYRDERAAERNAQSEALKAQERGKERAHEVRLLELRATTNSDVDYLDSTLRPKLPMFNDNDDITAYLIRFERIASLLKLNKPTYAVRLGSLLGGRALKKYAALSPAVTGDYDSLKKALLDGFNKTPESYREQFRTMRIGQNETYQQFATQLNRVLDFWFESRG